MLFGSNKNFTRKKTDSGQIKCLAFRSFNEKKKFWMKVMREKFIDPGPFFRIRRISSPTLTRQKWTKAQGRPTQGSPLKKRFFRGFY